MKYNWDTQTIVVIKPDKIPKKGKFSKRIFTSFVPFHIFMSHVAIAVCLRYGSIFIGKKP